MPSDGAVTRASAFNPALQAQDNNLQAELAKLHDVIPPPPIPWWPPAPGWWILFAVLCVMAVAGSIWLYKRRQHFLATRYQREADGLLDAIPDSADTLEQLQHIARVLRRAAISAYGRERVGTLPWLELAVLPGNGILDEHSLALLGRALYQQLPPGTDEINALLAQARRWLQLLPPHRVDNQ